MDIGGSWSAIAAHFAKVTVPKVKRCFGRSRGLTKKGAPLPPTKGRDRHRGPWMLSRVLNVSRVCCRRIHLPYRSSGIEMAGVDSIHMDSA